MMRSSSYSFRLLAALGAMLLCSPPAWTQNVLSTQQTIVLLPENVSSPPVQQTLHAVQQEISQDAGLHVIDADLAQQVLEYAPPTEPGQWSDALQAQFDRAQQKYFDFEYAEALVETRALIGATQPLYEVDVSIGNKLLSAWMLQALIARAQGDIQLLRESVYAALNLNPLLKVDQQEFPPSLVKSFSDAQRDLLTKSSGRMRLESDPPAVEVRLNGCPIGITPISISDLPVGTYRLQWIAPQYLPVESVVQVVAGEESQVMQRLRWAPESVLRRKQSEHQQRARISIALQSLETLRADRGVIISERHVGDRVVVSGQVVVRSLGAGLAPIQEELVGDVNIDQQRLHALSQNIRALLKQSDAQLRNKIEFLGLGRVLAQQPQQPLYRRPVFWGAVGGAAVVGLVVGLAAALSGGGSAPRTGALRVQFQ